MFHLLEREVEFSFRGEKRTVKAGTTLNVPANAPHFFTNKGDAKVRMLCMCTPAGQEEFFMAVGEQVASRTSPAPEQTEDDERKFLAKAEAVAGKFRTELLKP